MRFAKDEVLLRVEHDIGLLAELYSIFKSELPQRLANIESSFANGNFSAAASDAHYLKGALANLGALEARDAAALLERRAKANEHADYDHLVQTFKLRLSEFAAEITAFLKQS